MGTGAVNDISVVATGQTVTGKKSSRAVALLTLLLVGVSASDVEAVKKIKNLLGPGDEVVQAPVRGVEITLKRPPGVTDAQWQSKLDALNAAAAEGRAKVVHQPVRSGAAQRQARAEGRISPGDDADHALDLQFGGQDVSEEIISTNSTVNRSVGAQGHQRLRHPDGMPITCFKDDCR